MVTAIVDHKKRKNTGVYVWLVINYRPDPDDPTPYTVEIERLAGNRPAIKRYFLSFDAARKYFDGIDGEDS